MKVSMAWLKELVDVHEDGPQLAEKLTHGGIEVEGVEDLSAGLAHVVVGKILGMEKHPNATKLWICQVDVGAEVRCIVTGATNLQVGDRVPVALPGAHLPNGLKIEVGNLRGIESAGMLCSTEELLLDESLGGERSRGGIFILDEKAPVGETLAKGLGREDQVLDLELYPNRPDCLAMVNVAREVASLTEGALHLPAWAVEAEGLPREDLPVPLCRDFSVVIDAEDLCQRYAGLLVEDVSIAPSPQWMQARLLAAGVRPINNIVDITNYCMMEMGQPLHAFDLDKIHGTIHVRRAKADEVLTTLDKTKRTLDEGMLIIADEENPLAVAGVMGGLDSEVTGQTKRLFIESAHFHGVSVRRTSRRLGLRSEASNRFEKGVNPYVALAVLGRAGELISQLGAGKAVGYVDRKGSLPAVRVISLSASRASSVLGVEVEVHQIKEILVRLGFAYQAGEDGQSFSVRIPTYRSDLHCEEDLIEEVARLMGYERIPTTLPQGDTTQGERSREQKLRRRVRQVLIGAGMNETITYSFTSAAKDGKWSSLTPVPLLNPLREELGVMRTVLLPSLLEVAQRNLARRNSDLVLFEIGHVYHPESLPLKSLPKEVSHLAGVAVGKSAKHWLQQTVHYDFYYIKGIIEALAEELGVVFEYRPLSGEREKGLLHPGRSAEIWAGTSYLGIMGELHPVLQKEEDLERAVVFELDLDLLFEQVVPPSPVKSIPRFPALTRDLAIVVGKGVPAEAVLRQIKALGGELLQAVDLFDVYTGKPIPEDRKSLAFSLKYQSFERTLTDDEVNLLNSRILDGIQQDFAAEWRK